MPRIPDEEIDRLKRETDLAVLVRSRGVELRKHARDLVGRCLFHDDQGLSFVVTPVNLTACPVRESGPDVVCRAVAVGEDG